MSGTTPADGTHGAVTGIVPAMQAVTSYLRHLVVTGIFLAVEQAGLPMDGLGEAADAVAAFVVATLVWAVAKYLPLLRDLKRSAEALADALAESDDDEDPPAPPAVRASPAVFEPLPPADDTPKV